MNKIIKLSSILLFSIFTIQTSFAIDDSIKKETIDLHNKYRYEVFDITKNPIKWDDKLYQDAKDWANYLAEHYTKEDNKLGKSPHAKSFDAGKHNFGLRQGENIARFYTKSNMSDKEAIKSSITLFGDEKKDYNYEKNNIGHNTGHYTQIIWQDTSKVACATAKSKTDIDLVWVVCRYLTPGNVYNSQGKPLKPYIKDEEYIKKVVEELKKPKGKGIIKDYDYQGYYLDTKNNLYWSKEVKISTPEKMDDYCKKLNIDGFKDWKVPSFDLLSDFIKELDKSDVKPSYYGSFPTCMAGISNGGYVDFRKGNIGNSINFEGKAAIRCVRGKDLDRIEKEIQDENNKILSEEKAKEEQKEKTKMENYIEEYEILIKKYPENILNSELKKAKDDLAEKEKITDEKIRNNIYKYWTDLHKERVFNKEKVALTYEMKRLSKKIELLEKQIKIKQAEIKKRDEELKKQEELKRIENEKREKAEEKKQAEIKRQEELRKREIELKQKEEKVKKEALLKEQENKRKQEQERLKRQTEEKRQEELRKQAEKRKQEIEKQREIQRQKQKEEALKKQNENKKQIKLKDNVGFLYVKKNNVKKEDLEKYKKSVKRFNINQVKDGIENVKNDEYKNQKLKALYDKLIKLENIKYNKAISRYKADSRYLGHLDTTKLVQIKENYKRVIKRYEAMKDKLEKTPVKLEDSSSLYQYSYKVWKKKKNLEIIDAKIKYMKDMINLVDIELKKKGYKEYTVKKVDNNLNKKVVKTTKIKKTKKVKSNPKLDRILNNFFIKIDKQGEKKAQLLYKRFVVKLDTLIKKSKNPKKTELLEYIKVKFEEKLK